ncbi:MAG: protein kinase, partial [Acidobacteriota bacterium]
KPDNVFLTDEDHVKILDFGLAKLTELDQGSGDALSMSPTALGTMAGQLMGTAAYMAPEQARGESVDQRADIWAFGVVLYEMLTGQRLFRADSVSDTVAAVLRDDIDLSRLPGQTPAIARHVLARCLERDARRRLHHIADARIEIEDALAGHDDATAASAHNGTVPAAGMAPPAAGSAGRARFGRVVPWLVAAAMGVVALVGFWRSPQADGEGQSMRLKVHLSPGVPLDTAVGPAFAISPDGTRVAYVAGGRLYVQFMNELEARPLASTDGAWMPFFSPDGEWVAYFTAGDLFKVSVNGGTPLSLAQVSQPRGGTWSGDTIVYAPDTAGGLWKIPAAGGEAAPLTTPDAEAGERSHRWPHALPDGEHVLFSAQRRGQLYGEAAIAVVTLSTGERQDVEVAGAFPLYAASGHLLFVRGSTLFATPFDLGTLQPSGPAVAAVQGVMAQSGGEQVDNGSAQIAVSDAGTLLYHGATAASDAVLLVLVDDTGNAKPLDFAPRGYSSPTISPDGRRVAVHISDDNGSDIWVLDLDSGGERRITFDANSIVPVWSPDGAELAYLMARPGTTANIYSMRSDGGGDEHQVTTVDSELIVPGSFSPDGHRLSYYQRTSQGNSDSLWEISTVDLDDGTIQSLVETSGPSGWPTFSPDGRWIAYMSTESARAEVFVRDAGGGSGKWQVSTEGGNFPRWAADGSMLYFESNSHMMAVAVQPNAETFSYGPPRELFSTAPYVDRGDFSAYDVMPDGSGFLMLSRGAAGPGSAAEDVTMVLDFFSILRETASERAR